MHPSNVVDPSMDNLPTFKEIGTLAMINYLQIIQVHSPSAVRCVQSSVFE